MAGRDFALVVAVLLVIVIAQLQLCRGLEISCDRSWQVKSQNDTNAGVTFICGGIWSVVSGGHRIFDGAAAHSCLDIKQRGRSRGDGFYKLATACGGTYRAYCDMTLDGGGWTLFATKVSYNFKFMANVFNTKSAGAVSADGAGCIPNQNWKEVMFRFADDKGASRVVYSRNGGKPGTGKTAMNSAMSCGGPVLSTKGVDTDGFYRHSPHVHGGRRDPREGYYSPKLWVAPTGRQLSGPWNHNHKFVGMWTSSGGSRYFYADSNKAKTTKCIAGYCSLKSPIWLMYR